MLIATWSLVRPGAMRAGHEITMGMRSPPSSKSVFLPVNGQMSAKRSPPLSLVKMTIVFWVRPPVWALWTDRAGGSAASVPRRRPTAKEPF
jgi:hypothetical protein